MKIHFVLPSKNEKNTLPEIIQNLHDLAKKQLWNIEIFLVDDSDDGTKSAAKEWPVTRLDGDGVGLGYSMLKGLHFARYGHPDWIVTMDTDGQVDLGELKKFIDYANTEKTDLLLSSRFLQGQHLDYKYPLINWIGNRLLVFYLRKVTALPITDSHGGIRVYSPKSTDGLFLYGRHTYVQETIVQIAKKGGKIRELPSRWKERSFSSSRVLKSILRYVCRTAPALLLQSNSAKLLVVALNLIPLFFQNWIFFVASNILLVFLFWVSSRKVKIDDFDSKDPLQLHSPSRSSEAP